MRSSLRLLTVLAPLTAFACASTSSSEEEDAQANAIRASAALRIGVSSEPTSIDPHYDFLDPNINVGKPVFEALYEYGPEKQIVPLLATGGAPTHEDPRVWAFSLRRDVKFHHGAAFTKEDVLCNFRRLLASKTIMAGYRAQLSVVDMEATEAKNAASEDPYTLYVQTKQPYGFLTSNLASIFLVSCDAAQKATALETQATEATRKQVVQDAFTRGDLADGTGPYRYESWVPLATDREHARVALAANAGYWGKAPTWSRIEVGFEPDAERRVARLLSGDFALVDAVPGPRVASVEAAGFQSFRARGLRVMHMWLNQGRDGREAKPEHVPLVDDAGTAYPSPFTSKAFRRALALATDKRALVDVMGGLAIPTGQMLPPGRVGHLEGRPDDEHDVPAARRAFAAAAKELPFLAGKKLTLTIHGTNDRYPNDAKILEAVAQQWTAAFASFDEGGTHFALSVVAKPAPKAEYFAKTFAYNAGLLGGGIDNGHAEGALRLYLLPESGLNYGRYANADVKARYLAGTAETDERTRDATLTGALAAALDDDALLPLYNPVVVWAGRKDLTFTPRVDDVTLPDRIGRK